jgi:hypothetical protein
VKEARNFREVRSMFMESNMAPFRNKLGDVYKLINIKFLCFIKLPTANKKKTKSTQNKKNVFQISRFRAKN